MALTAQPSIASSTVKCHCFHERTYSADHPTKFDPYLLATTQNRLMAVIFNLPRKDIVKMKMSGVPESYLWVALWIQKHSVFSLEQINSLFHESQSWRSIVMKSKADPEALGSFFMEALADGRTDAMAWAVVHYNLKNSLDVSEKDWLAIQDKKASLKEAILTFILAGMYNQDPAILHLKAQTDGWGSFLAEKNSSIEQIDSYLRRHFPTV
jgi:hypothetical protein